MYFDTTLKSEDFEMQAIEYNTALKKALFERKMSQQELSRKTGIPQSYISRLINGNMALSRQRLTLIAEALDKTVAELFGE
jgi:transcriptional regulator with XRE-family HTH domain